ncbi:MAG TPA: sensor domain-containing diguanylate cyclase [Steroidobacteraceae bacterium]|nr:sensor domain-containing diguanylate cyclase [Steroidobacteraceae bacterium]
MIRRDANQQSAARALELEQVLEQTGEAVLVKDLNAVVTYWNREATVLYGFSAQEAVGQPLRKLHAAHLSEADYALLLERVRAGIPTSSIRERRKKTGESIRVALKTTPLLNAQGELVGEITVARDVTELHRTEEALRAAQVTLQSRMATIRDANRNLAREVAARRKADAAMRRNNKALGATVRQLESFHHDDGLLSRMVELLQSCTRRSEVYAIVREIGAQLFPDASGSLFIYRNSRDVLEHVTSWGSGRAPETTLPPDECWALRMGGPHFVPQQGTIRCRHVHADAESYACMPVHGQGRILGLLHFAVEVSPRTGRPARDVEHRLRAMTDRIGPALANLRLTEALREMALHDTLTGLYNRRYLDDALNRELLRAERSGKPVSVVMIDIDHFKRFNDKHGHDAGDFVLSAVARAITNSVRPSDMACRYGGEELAVVFSDVGLDCARERAELMRLAIRDTNLTHLGHTLPSPTASFGIAVYPANGTTPADLLKAADQALYRAKQEGRDRVCVAAEAPRAVG